MGSRQSRLTETASQGTSEDEGTFSVTATPELIASLKGGKKIPNGRPKTMEEAYQKGIQDAFELARKEREAEESKAAIARETSLRQSEEASKLRTSIIAKQYSEEVARPPSNPLKCAAAEEAVIKCYKEQSSSKGGDVLVCSSLVSALEDCAKSALQVTNKWGSFSRLQPDHLYSGISYGY